MNHINSLIRLIDAGLTTQVILTDGRRIAGFCPHDLVVRGHPAAGVVLARGIVHGAEQAEDRVVPLCDVAGVFSERPQQRCGRDSQFSSRNPVPRGWTLIHARA